MLKINLVLNDSAKVLENYFVKNPKLDAEILLSKVLKRNVKDMVFNDSIKVNEKQRQTIAIDNCTHHQADH